MSNKENKIKEREEEERVKSCMKEVNKGFGEAESVAQKLIKYTQGEHHMPHPTT